MLRRQLNQGVEYLITPYIYVCVHLIFELINSQSSLPHKGAFYSVICDLIIVNF